MSLKSFAKSRLLAAVSAVTGRHAVLLPPEAKSEEALLDVKAPYRVEGDRLRLELLESDPGTLAITLLGYEGHFPRRRLWSGAAPYAGPASLDLDTRSGVLRLSETNVGKAALPPGGRRFCLELELRTSASVKRRTTGHYLAANQGRYYDGGNYVDYEAEAKGDVPKVLELLERHHAEGPLLEVGCATGIVLEAVAARGIECYGVDYSPEAVARASERCGAGRIFEGNPEQAPLPASLAARGPFRALLLWAVLEHFHEPFRVLERLTAHVAPGGKVFINTTNAESLNRFLFETEWEGYFDTSHHGVDAVSVGSLRRELPRLGWRIESLSTYLSWDSNADPTHETLRQWWASDARFRRLLTERDRGDLVTCVAVKT